MNVRTRKILMIGLAVLALGACSVKKVDEAHVGVKYTDGPIEGKKWDGVVEPGGSHTVINDHVYQLPARQVTYIMGDKPGEPGVKCDECDAPSLTLTAQQGEKLRIAMAVRFFLNTRETTLKPFFLEICQKHDCWNDDGWIKMLNETFGNPSQAVINDLGLDYNAEQLRYDNTVKDDFASKFATTFVDSQERLIGHGDYFCGPGYKRSGEDCPTLSVEITSVVYENGDLENIRTREELAARQQALAEQETATATAQQATAAARATPENLALMEAEAMLECAKKPECRLTIIVGNDTVGVSVPTG